MATVWRTAMVACLLGGCAPSAPPAAAVASHEIAVGRYVIVHSPQAERDTVLLDTATGRTWSRVELGDLRGQPPGWEPMPQLNTQADYQALIDKYGLKARKAESGPGEKTDDQ